MYLTVPFLFLLQACRDKGVDCIVAPYEADAQLTYLMKIGIAQLVITEDSDLILFGCDRVSTNRVDMLTIVPMELARHVFR